MKIKLSLLLLGFTEDMRDSKMRKIEDLVSKFQGPLVSMVRFWLFTKNYLLTDKILAEKSGKKYNLFPGTCKEESS